MMKTDLHLSLFAASFVAANAFVSPPSYTIPLQDVPNSQLVLHHPLRGSCVSTRQNKIQHRYRATRSSVTTTLFALASIVKVAHAAKATVDTAAPSISLLPTILLTAAALLLSIIVLPCVILILKRLLFPTVLTHPWQIPSENSRQRKLDRETSVVFAGSFNPPHHGHLVMISYLAERCVRSLHIASHCNNTLPDKT